MRNIALIYGFAFALMWSSAFTSARVIATHAPPLYALSVRFFLSGIVAILIALLMGQTWQLDKTQWRAVLIFGICQNALYLGLNFVAMTQVEASFAAIIASTLPLLVALVGRVFYKTALSGLGYAGLVSGLIGVALIMGTRLDEGGGLWGFALCGIGVLALTMATLVIGNSLTKGNVMMIVAMQMFVGALSLLPFALLLEVPSFTPSPALAFAFAYTVLVPGVLATFVWFLLVAEIGPVKAASFHFLNPVFGVAIAAFFLGETLSLLDVLGVAIIATSIYLVQTSRQRPLRTG